MSDSPDARFASLVQPHFAALYRAALRLTRRRHDAEDLVQEVCLRAWSGPRGARGRCRPPRAWLMRALYHLFIDTARRRRLRLRLHRFAGRREGCGVTSDEAGPERAADASAHARARRRRLGSARARAARAVVVARRGARSRGARRDLRHQQECAERAPASSQAAARQLLAAGERNPKLELVETQAMNCETIDAILDEHRTARLTIRASSRGGASRPLRAVLRGLGGSRRAARREHGRAAAGALARTFRASERYPAREAVVGPRSDRVRRRSRCGCCASRLWSRSSDTGMNALSAMLLSRAAATFSLSGLDRRRRKPMCAPAAPQPSPRSSPAATTKCSRSPRRLSQRTIRISL